LGAADPAEGTERGQKVDGFQEIRFALSVLPQEDMEPRLEDGVQSGEVPEISEAQTSQMHANELAGCEPSRQLDF